MTMSGGQKTVTLVQSQSGSTETTPTSSENATTADSSSSTEQSASSSTECSVPTNSAVTSLAVDDEALAAGTAASDKNSAEEQAKPVEESQQKPSSLEEDDDGNINNKNGITSSEDRVEQNESEKQSLSFTKNGGENSSSIDSTNNERSGDFNSATTNPEESEEKMDTDSSSTITPNPLNSENKESIPASENTMNQTAFNKSDAQDVQNGVCESSHSLESKPFLNDDIAMKMADEDMEDGTNPLSALASAAINSSMGSIKTEHTTPISNETVSYYYYCIL